MRQQRRVVAAIIAAALIPNPNLTEMLHVCSRLEGAHRHVG